MKLILIQLTCLSLVISTFIICFWLVYPYNVVKQYSPLIVLNKRVKIGEHLQIVHDVCKYMNVPGQVIPALVSNVVILMPAINSNTPVGCYKVTSRTYQIPQQASLGKQHMTFDIEYKVNPIRWIDYKFETEYFEVIE